MNGTHERSSGASGFKFVVTVLHSGAFILRTVRLWDFRRARRSVGHRPIWLERRLIPASSVDPERLNAAYIISEGI